ncbi:type VI secretion system protein TssA [Arhodomonas aquaeolei]|uniref:type VI secretion system protein TssA n=1 Tax=Arhodomonas aquaeolei TaxID=2369 RepID=UPI000372EB81|nr:type VI secretion system protein TssA [Arhodomonas aquaeolei]
MQTLGDLTIEALTAPVDGGSGEDLAFSLLFDEIKEARRADPTYLPQGDWEVDLKRSDWEAVVHLSSEVLAGRSKDLQLAAWLTEGLAHREGFPGIRFGLTLTRTLLEQFWDTLYPELDPDPEERVARLNWLASTLAEVARGLPLVQGNGYALVDYEESREVENQARADADAMQAALAEGKINDELFQRSVVLSDTAFLQERHDGLQGCLDALSQLEACSDACFGVDGPGYSALQAELEQCRDLVARLLRERGVTDMPEEAGEANDGPAGEAVWTVPAPAAAGGRDGALRTQPETREEAFEMLAGVSRFFRQSEPHSPVPYLVERAVKWGRMPLEEWLRDVIRDDGVIEGIRDTLGTRVAGEE